MKGSLILKILLAVLLAIFVINQLFSSIYEPIKTESAIYYTATDGFNITGVIIRNETLVHYSGGGVMHYVVSDGNRVAKNGVIANIYDSEEASILVSQNKEIEKKIKDIEEIIGYNDIEAANLDLINAKINEKINNLNFSASAGNYDNVHANSDELLTAFLRRKAAMGETTDFSAQLDVLKAQLNTNLPTPKTQITAEESGYFVSSADGYEKVFNGADIVNLTPELLESASSEKYDNTVMGKIVSDYEWYIAANVSLNDSLKFKEGDSLKIITSVKSSPELSVTVKKINVSESEAKAVIIFACNEMNKELASMRSGPMTVVKSQFSGLRVSKKSLRVVDSVRGVYVQNGMQVNFVPVDIIYSDESFIICAKQNEVDKGLKLYDRVVVKGKGLYDGKIVG